MGTAPWEREERTAEMSRPWAWERPQTTRSSGSDGQRCPAAGERHGGGGVLHREEGHDVAQHAVGEKADDVLPVFFLHGRRLGLNLSHLYPANPNKQGFFWI